jgi:peptidoglycan/LPS O-acetylase OafA/YrhL
MEDLAYVSRTKTLSGIRANLLSSIKATRLKEIDFLRGVAILLVLTHHHELTSGIGWIGVDLFFVLSGFLVSGLLFNEYRKWNKIDPKLFLIRRGFKIYPLFYFFIALTIVVRILAFKLTHRDIFAIAPQKVLGEIFFLQNYIGGLWIHTWSLAVEEHFYFLLAFMLFVLAKFNRIENQTFMIAFCLSIIVALLILRIVVALEFPEYITSHQTHFRIDALMFGVLISYLYSYKREALSKFVERRMILIASISPVLIALPLVVSNQKFGFSVGLSLLSLGFSGVLLIFLLSPGTVRSVEKIMSRPGFQAVATIGFYSYSIYLFHLFAKNFILGAITQAVSLHTGIQFFLYIILAITSGIVATSLIEIPFLRMRDKFFPKTA